MLQIITALNAAFFAFPIVAFANNACPAPAITTAAAVTTSYGAEYEVQTTYRSANEIATKFIRKTETTFAVEGPFVWTRSDSDESEAGDKERRFAIGHHYHALLLHFDDMIENIKTDEAIPFGDETRSGRTGLFPYGGKVSLVVGNDTDRPAGLVLALPGESLITVTFNNWRTTPNAIDVPYEITLKHEQNIFNYSYTHIDLNELDAIDFQQRYAAPAFDNVQIYRLHRKLLAAHCRGDAALIAQLSTPTGIIANRGEVFEVTQDDTQTQFESLFTRLNYTGYHDLQDPQIRVAKSGELGWAVVNVRAEGTAKATDTPFSQKWAWVMLARKIDGVWLHAGNASNSGPVK